MFTTADTRNDHTWFVGARVGWLMTPDVLNYWSVGYTRTHFTGGNLRNSFTGAELPNAHLASTEAGGWFLGGGLEVAMHKGWFWRSEVRYADYSKEARAETGISPVLPAELRSRGDDRDQPVRLQVRLGALRRGRYSAATGFNS